MIVIMNLELIGLTVLWNDKTREKVWKLAGCTQFVRICFVMYVINFRKPNILFCYSLAIYIIQVLFMNGGKKAKSKKIGYKST